MARPTHTLNPAKLKDGVTLSDIPAGDSPAGSDSSADDGVISGKALIFWDPDTPGKKLDAIDTDQITPAAEAVPFPISESISVEPLGSVTEEAQPAGAGPVERLEALWLETHAAPSGDAAESTEEVDRG